ncbi:MAG: pyridoxal kinase [Bdellovibrionales bacterium]
MSILSIQSHVAYGYVGNKAAVYPLQSMGYDVWPVNTVQFSNHTGYGKWTGEIFSAQHVRDVVRGIEELGKMPECQAILSGYMGSREICEAVADTAQHLKAANPSCLYLCDPVIGNTTCFVKPEVLDFFKTGLTADILTPNHYEASTLSGIEITDVPSLRRAAAFYHERGIGIVVITGAKLPDVAEGLCVVVCENGALRAMKTKEVQFSTPVNGTGDLFSASFLGAYLRYRDAGQALCYATTTLQTVLENTLHAQTRELQVLSMRYDLPAQPAACALIEL